MIYHDNDIAFNQGNNLKESIYMELTGVAGVEMSVEVMGFLENYHGYW